MVRDGSLQDLIGLLVREHGSDLHLKVGSPPVTRIRGLLAPVEGYGVLELPDTEAFLAEIIPENLVEEFESVGEADFSYETEDGRFRVNAFKQRGAVSIAMRYIPFEIPEFESLGLPEAIRTLAFEERGIVLITGTTGSGKSTTLASMINMVNHAIAKHVVTIEDPIEFIHRDDRSIINQREVGTDTASFALALRRVLRQDPDMILIGEIRDAESAQLALSAAETGHERNQVRTMIAGTLKGIIGQRLIRTKSGYRAAVCEVMVSTGRIRDFIMDPAQTGQIEQAISEGEYYGMQTFDQALLKLVEEDRVDYEEAVRMASRPQDFRLMVYALGKSEA
jgi:twitching motility protein PilT